MLCPRPFVARSLANPASHFVLLPHWLLPLSTLVITTVFPGARPGNANLLCCLDDEAVQPATRTPDDPRRLPLFLLSLRPPFDNLASYLRHLAAITKTNSDITTAVTPILRPAFPSLFFLLGALTHLPSSHSRNANGRADSGRATCTESWPSRGPRCGTLATTISHTATAALGRSAPGQVGQAAGGASTTRLPRLAESHRDRYRGLFREPDRRNPFAQRGGFVRR